MSPVGPAPTTSTSGSGVASHGTPAGRSVRARCRRLPRLAACNVSLLSRSPASIRQATPWPGVRQRVRAHRGAPSEQPGTSTGRTSRRRSWRPSGGSRFPSGSRRRCRAAPGRSARPSGRCAAPRPAARPGHTCRPVTRRVPGKPAGRHVRRHPSAAAAHAGRGPPGSTPTICRRPPQRGQRRTSRANTRIWTLRSRVTDLWCCPASRRSATPELRAKVGSDCSRIFGLRAGAVVGSGS